MVKIRDQVNRGRRAASASRPSTCASAAPICRSRFRKRCSAACRASARARRPNIAPRAPSRRRRSRAKADRDVVVLLGDAQRQADQTRGDGDAERNRIFAEAYGKDADFFAFYRSMQAYEAGLKSGETRMVVSPKSEFFRFFGSAKGEPQPAAETPSPSVGGAAQKGPS